MKTTWVSHRNTYIILRLDRSGQLREWRPVGYVILRQIYEGTQACWSAWVFSEPHDDRVGCLETLGQAKQAVEEELRRRDMRRGPSDHGKEQ